MKYLVEKLKNSLSEEFQGLLVYIDEETFPSKRRALVFLEKLSERIGNEGLKTLGEKFLKDLLKLASYSQFLGDFLVRHPELLPSLKEVYKVKFSREDFSFRETFKTEREFLNKLRLHKNFHMARVLLRDILSLAPFEELVRDVTFIHDSLVKEAYSFALSDLIKKYGEPGCGFIVVAMGKAAGFELNYSSDLDLIYVYEDRYGYTTGGSYGKLQRHDFFVLLSKKITEILSKKTEEGICVVVDTRLRPNGTMGPECNDLEALEKYYTAIARPWERFALLKSRPAVGELKKLGMEFLKLAKSFVFVKYVDLSLIEEVLSLKEKIKAKVRKRGEKIDLKLGAGGIREIEFIVQAFQLIYGGKYPFIRARHTLTALKRLKDWGFLDFKEYEDLREAYLFLRRCEHMLQVTHFRQTQTFHPESEEAEELSVKMGFKSRKEFLDRLDSHMSKVNSYFNKFFPTGGVKTLSALTLEDYCRLGFKHPEEVKRLVEVLLNSRFLLPEEVQKIDLWGEKFLKFLLEAPVPETALKNLLLFIEKEEGKLFFFSVLGEVHILKLLLFLLSTENFFLSRFRQTPEILEWIFQPELIENPVNCQILEKKAVELGNDLRLLKNLFEVVSLLRFYLKRTSLKQFFEELTEVADFCIERLSKTLDLRVTLASLGKHGSREMNVGSDLDLLFVSPSQEEKEKEKDKVVDFIKRLEGLGYEVDTRLRPFGEKGEIVFTLKYFSSYLKETARLWERLAFTRFRFLSGTLEEKLEGLVEEFLFSKFLTLKDLEEIKELRETLANTLGKGKNDVKYGRGGVVDLEFVSYIYQVYIRRKIGNTFEVLSLLAEEGETFKEGLLLYEKLRKAELEKRLFGKFLSFEEVVPLKERTREFYQGFLEWIESELSKSTL